MASSMLLKVTCLAMICLVLGIPLANAAPSCPAVAQTLTPCLPHVSNPGPSPPQPCCNRVKTLNSQAKTTQDRHHVCGCLKSLMAGIPGLNLPAFASVAKDCGVDIGYIISPNTDCSKIN
ncbi:non-specific lipid-transfer protein [Medicago truncatula]|nr:non-specific lipid-transfer protein [Medicago truncatula]